MYSLGRACWIVRNLDGSPRRLAIFTEVVQKNLKVRFFYVIYEAAPLAIKALLLWCYGLKCYLSLDWDRSGRAELATFASFHNEHVAIGHILDHVEGLASGNIAASKRNCLSPAALRALPAFLASSRRLLRLCRRLARRFHFLPACRVFSTMTYYARFRQLLERPGVKAVLITNHYSPECLAVAAAAHRARKKVIFANHANATWDSGFVPPLYSDLAAVTSQAVLDIYRRHSPRELRAVFIPLASAQRPMRSRLEDAQPLSVGIFLTALTNMARLRTLVEQLSGNPRVGDILIRPHPVEVIKDDLSALCAGGGRVKDTFGMPLFDNIKLCDVVVCGNSTVTVELLRGGVPVLYDGELDGLPYDYNGYMKHELVLPVPAELNDAALASIGDFYDSAAWFETMRYFDAGYQRDEAEMFRQLAEAMREVLA